MSKTITIIPARLASTRLPNKPLLNINGKLLIQHVYEHCKKAIAGEVIIAAGDQEIIEACEKFGARAVLTNPELPSGTDRIAAALEKLGESFDVVVNFQGDNINVDPTITIPLVKMVEENSCDIATLGYVLQEEEAKSPNVVKIIMGISEGEDKARALYFTRALAPYIREPERGGINKSYYGHLGIYVFKESALKKCVTFPPSVLEEREKLEQLRWLERGMVIYAKLVGDVRLYPNIPLEINTEEEYRAAVSCRCGF